MVVQHNLTAMNSNRMLGVTTSSQAKSTEKLSSGYKINRAADDAAGLSISEKMRKQIRGLTQASLNAEDGISAVQTAEGALNEVQDMLQRMNELAVKAANGTMSENDRSYIQNEIDQLTTEIDRVAETTKFNETYLLKGDKQADAEYAFKYFAGEATIADNTTLYDKDGNTIASDEELFELLEAGEDVYKTAPAAEAVAGTDYEFDEGEAGVGTATNALIFVKGTTSEAVAASGSIAKYIGTSGLGTEYTAMKEAASDDVTLNSGTDATTADVYIRNDTTGEITKIANGTAISADTDQYTFDGSGHKITAKAGYSVLEAATSGDYNIVSNAIAASATITNNVYAADGTQYSTTTLAAALSADPDTKIYTSANGDGEEATANTDYTYTSATASQYYDKDGNKISANALSNYFETDGTTITQKADTKLYDADGEELALTADDIAAQLRSEALVGALTLKLHVGADATANNQIAIDLHAMSAKGLGVEGLKVDGADDTNALAAIDTIKEAIQKVSTQRSALGAVQNRLEHTIANLDNVVENTTSAESQIRDTDMATEMVKYSNNNILAQAGTSMLAQANQANQNVLSLLG